MSDIFTSLSNTSLSNKDKMKLASSHLNLLMKEINDKSVNEAYKIIKMTEKYAKEFVIKFTYEKCILRFLSKVWHKEMYDILEELVKNIENINTESSDIYIMYCIIKYRKYKEIDPYYKKYIEFCNIKFKNKLICLYDCINGKSINNKENSINEKSINTKENSINIKNHKNEKIGYSCYKSNLDDIIFINTKVICNFTRSDIIVSESDFYKYYSMYTATFLKDNLFSKLLDLFTKKKYKKCKDLIKIILQDDKYCKLHVYNILIYCYVQMGMYQESIFYIDRSIIISEGKIRWYFINYKLCIERLGGIPGPVSYLKINIEDFTDLSLESISIYDLLNNKLRYNIFLEDSTKLLREVRNYDISYTNSNELTDVYFNKKITDLYTSNIKKDSLYNDLNLYDIKNNITLKDYTLISLYVIKDILYLSIYKNNQYIVHDTLINYFNISNEYNRIINKNKEILKNEKITNKWWSERIKLDRDLKILVKNINFNIELEDDTIFLILDEKTIEFPFEYTEIFYYKRCYRLLSMECLNKKYFINNTINNNTFKNNDINKNINDKINDNINDNINNNINNINNDKNNDINNINNNDKNKNSDMDNKNNDKNNNNITFLLDTTLKNTYKRITTTFNNTNIININDNISIKEEGIICYFGHGNGCKYINENIMNSVLFLFGCSSIKLVCVNNYKKNGKILKYIKNNRTVLGCLYEVTDKDLDLFSIELLNKKGDLSDSIKESRKSMKLKYLNGCSIVVYGLPYNLTKI